MNVALTLWSSADCFGQEARVGEEGGSGGPGRSHAGVAAVRTPRKALLLPPCLTLVRGRKCIWMAQHVRLARSERMRTV